jgi:hypothetical protein
MGSVIPFRDPDAPPEGAERRAAIKAYYKAAEAIAADAVARAFSAASRQPDCRRIDLNDAVPLFVAAFRRELSRSGY